MFAIMIKNSNSYEYFVGRLPNGLMSEKNFANFFASELEKYLDKQIINAFFGDSKY